MYEGPSTLTRAENLNLKPKPTKPQGLSIRSFPPVHQAKPRLLLHRRVPLPCSVGYHNGTACLGGSRGASAGGLPCAGSGCTNMLVGNPDRARASEDAQCKYVHQPNTVQVLFHRDSRRICPKLRQRLRQHPRRSVYCVLQPANRHLRDWRKRVCAGRSQPVLPVQRRYF